MARRKTFAVHRAPQGKQKQPVSTVKWVARELLHANSYNPNVQAPPELALLKISLLEDGWTSALVIRPDYEIVDGYHRWLVAADPEVAAMTGGEIPVCVLVSDEASQMLSTIRHNRARGTHHVVKMADIVAELAAGGMDAGEIGVRLGMEREEVQRLLDRGSLLRTDGEFSQAWAPALKKGERNEPAREDPDTRANRGRL